MRRINAAAGDGDAVQLALDHAMQILYVVRVHATTHAGYRAYHAALLVARQTAARRRLCKLASAMRRCGC